MTTVVNTISGTVVGNVVLAGSVGGVLGPVRSALAGLPSQRVFVGREAEVEALLDVLRPDASTSAAVVSSVGGLGGIGKTALVLRVAWQASSERWFPGGVLMTDMRGYDSAERQLSAASALGLLLSAMGVLAEAIPADLDGRSMLWRSILAERNGPDERVLIIVDNVSSRGQVQPLLPGGTAHRVLVTSRESLAAVQGVRLIDLDVLPDSSGTTLLATELSTARFQDDRVQRDPDSALRLVRLCCGLPLAVRTVSALLAAAPGQPLAELVASLEDERHRLEELHMSGDLSVRAAFNLSYQRLAEDEARAFRLFAVNSGPEISAQAAAELFDLGQLQANRLLRRLHHAYLISSGSSWGRWKMHDLLRLYAIELVERDEERDTAAARLLTYYRVSALAAVTELDPRSRSTGRFSSHEEALTWLDVEYPNLLASLSIAREVGLTRFLVDIPVVMNPYFEIRRHTNDWIATSEVAAAAARQLGDRAAEAEALTSLGKAHHDARRLADALECHERSLVIMREIGDRFGEGQTLSNIGAVHRIAGRPADAVKQYEASLAIRRELGDSVGEARTLASLGLTHRDLGETDKAVKLFGESLRASMASETTNGRIDLRGESFTKENLAEVFRELGRSDEARVLYEDALDTYQDQGNLRGEAIALYKLGALCLELGLADEGQAHRAKAQVIARQLARSVEVEIGARVQRG